MVKSNTEKPLLQLARAALSRGERQIGDCMICGELALLEERGTGPHVVSKILNHTLPGVGAVYMRADHYVAMRQALETWGSYVSSLA